jgi:DNA-binding response OmpR family regulator
MRVLVIEDDRELAEAIGVGLRREGMAVDTAFDGTAGLERATVNDYDVIVLDRDLPILHGDEVCDRLVAVDCRSRMLMLTAAGSIEDRVDGLGRGADDYMPKPFAFAELVARIQALFRRAQPTVPPILVHGDLQLDIAGHRVSRGGGSSSSGRRSSECSRCSSPRRGEWCRPRSCWSGHGTRWPIRSPPR